MQNNALRLKKSLIYVLIKNYFIKMDIKLHIEDIIQKINNKKFDHSEIDNSKCILNELKKREDIKIYRCLIDAIFILYKNSWKTMI